MKALALLVLAAILAGCADAPAADMDDSDPSLVPASTYRSGALTFYGNSSDARPLVGLTEFHWAIMEDAEAIVVELTVDFGAEQDCMLKQGSAEGPGPLGPRQITLQEGATGYGWSSGGTGQTSVHAGEVDTRQDSTGSGAGWSASRGPISGLWTITHMATRLVAGNDFVGGAALTFSIECNRDFAIVRAEGGAQVLLADEANLAGGMGADGGAASVNLGDGIALDIEAARVRAAGDAFGQQVTQVAFTQPDGQEDWSWTPLGGDLRTAEGGPGTYSFQVDRVSGTGAFWLAAWGLDGAIDLSANQLNRTLLDDPF